MKFRMFLWFSFTFDYRISVGHASEVLPTNFEAGFYSVSFCATPAFNLDIRDVIEGWMR